MPRRANSAACFTGGVILAVVLAATLVPAASADTQVDITPSLGWYSPTANAIEETVGPTTVEAKYDGALVYGGRLSIWLNPSVVLEGSGHFARSKLAGEAFGVSESVDLTMFYGSAVVGVALGAAKRLMIHGGIGLRGTNFDEGIEGSNFATGVIGLTGKAPLNDSVMLRVDTDAHVFSEYFEVGGVRSDERMQVDMILQVGLQFTPGGRSE